MTSLALLTTLTAERGGAKFVFLYSYPHDSRRAVCILAVEEKKELAQISQGSQNVIARSQAVARRNRSKLGAFP
jgi:hypothetical protein